jgi:lipopolysaccharide cholinephosphotransferase
MLAQNEELKKKLLDMLEWFHGFCVENNLRYYILGGTMLGAVRHQGFIPWDDDIDVGMPRDDYRRLESLLSSSKGKYILETPKSKNKDFIYPYSKLYDTETTLIENARRPVVRGVYLDIFPLDGTGNTAEESRDFYKKIKILTIITISLITNYNKERKLYKNIAVAVARVVPFWKTISKELLVLLDDLCSKKSFDDSKYGGNLLGNWLEREVMPRDVMGVPTPYTFESLTVLGPEKYEEYLTSLYGDWRKLPPEDKRKSHHVFLYLNLDESYLHTEKEERVL